MNRILQDMIIQEITNEEFQLISSLVYQNTGIFWDESKKTLAYTRLYKRLRTLGMKNFHEYYCFLKNDERKLEMQALINSVTTTKTDFFREKYQFDFLEQNFFPSLRKEALLKRNRKLRIWSAASSNGSEAYTIAILVSEHFGVLETFGWDIKILASDVNTKALSTAQAGVYTLDEVKPIPPKLLEKHFLKKNHDGKLFYQAKEHLKSLIQFRPINLLSSCYPIKARLDLIFCRNVLIYFDSKTRQTVLQRLQNYLQEGGYLFLGGSESTGGLSGYRMLKNNIYQKKLHSV